MQDKPTPQDIKDIRNHLKMSLQQLADKLGVAKYTVHRWEKGLSRPSQLAIRQLHRLDRKINS